MRFATDPLKNITVIHGFNGAGKTTILNAFTWLLYGECSPDFEEPDRLESESTFAGLAPGGKLATEVKAVFRDGDRKFTAVRTMSVEKDNNGSRRVTDPGKLRPDLHQRAWRGPGTQQSPGHARTNASQTAFPVLLLQRGTY